MDTMTDAVEVVVGGVDTHRDFHVGAVLDRVGAVLGTASFSATKAGYGEMLTWMTGFGALNKVGSEGTGSYGKGLTRHLKAHGIDVVEVNRPNRQARRRNGKSDTTDAIAAARAVLSNEATAVAKNGEGPVENVRLLRVVKDRVVKDRTTAMNEIRALIVTAPDEIREQLDGLSMVKIAKVVNGWDMPGELDMTAVALGYLVRRWEWFNAELKALAPQLKAQVAVAAPPKLLEMHGVGDHVASSIVIAMGDNSERLMRSDGCLAALAGTAPKDASSGLQQRHRLNRDGNRDLNSAIYRIVLVGLKSDQATKDYVARRMAEGKTKREAIRCVKRYVTRQIWKIYRDHIEETKAQSPTTEPLTKAA